MMRGALTVLTELGDLLVALLRTVRDALVELSLEWLFGPAETDWRPPR